MVELRTGEAYAASEEQQVITISDDEEQPKSTEDDKPISIILEDFKTLIQPVPMDKGDTFNRAEYQVSPLLTRRTEESNRIMTQFLDVCLPHLREKDIRYILERLKSLLCQTNLHYLASHGFQHDVIQMIKSIQADGSMAYVHLKDLTDELRAHREKKPKGKPHNSALLSGSLEADSQALSLDVARCLNQSSAEARPTCPESLPSISATGTPPVAEVSGSQENPSDPQPPVSSTAVEITNLVALLAPRMSTGEQPGTSGLAGKDGNHVHDSKHVEREVREQQQGNSIGCLAEKNGPSHRDSQNIQKLREYLLELCRHIKKLRAEEVDLNKDDEASAYIQEGKLVKRAWNIWQKICELEGRCPDTGCEQKKKFQFTGAPYPAVNAEVEKLVNKNKVFPDFTDIHNAVKQANEREDLRLGTKEARTIAEDVFARVGQELQRRRQADELTSAIAYLGDYGDYHRDPADSDPVLMAQLQENAKVYRKRMDDVIQAYVNRQQELKLEPQEVEEEDCDHSPDPDDSYSSENEEDDEEENIEDGMKNLEKGLFVNGSLSEGEQGAEEEAGEEECKPLCAAGSSASLANRESLESRIAGGGLSLAPTGNSNSAAQLPIKPIPGGALNPELPGDFSGIVQLDSPVCGSSAAAHRTITRVPIASGTAELTIIPVPVASGTTQLTVGPSQVPVASGKTKPCTSLATESKRGHGAKNGTIVMPEVSVFPFPEGKLSLEPKATSNGQKLPVKRQRCTSEKEHEGDVIMILSDDDETSVPPAKNFKC